MIKSRYVVIIALCFLMIAVCPPNAAAQSRQVDAEQTKTADIGRDDPFAKLVTNETLPILPAVSRSPGIRRNAPELFVQTVMLRFLDAKSLKQAIDRMISEFGSIAINEKNNSLIVCDTKENLARIVAEIRKADKTPRQIMIEVVILDVQLNDDTEIGINWDLLSDKRYDVGYRQNFTTNRLGSTQETSATIGDASAFNTTGLGGSFSIISGTVRSIVHLIQQKREVEILASPSVMMVSGESASIQAVEELPYTEIRDTAAGGAAAITSTQFKNVGIQLDVEATLTDNNDIFLTVDAEQNVATGQSNTEIPIVDTRKANTSLLLKDGQVVIFGGLRRREKTKEVDQIPFLGDLPIIGELFKSTKIVAKNSELIIFISPHIYKGEPVPHDAMSKYNEIRDFSMLSSKNDRETIKKELLERIKKLQNEKNPAATEELLSNLTTLEKILGEEMRETLDSSEKVIPKESIELAGNEM